MLLAVVRRLRLIPAVLMPAVLPGDDPPDPAWRPARRMAAWSAARAGLRITKSARAVTGATVSTSRR